MEEVRSCTGEGGVGGERAKFAEERTEQIETPFLSKRKGVLKKSESKGKSNECK